MGCSVGRFSRGQLQLVYVIMQQQLVGHIPYCKDTEGNVFGIMQMDSQAK